MLLRIGIFASRICLILLTFSSEVAAVEDRTNDLLMITDCVPKDPLIASWTTLQINCTLNRTVPGVSVSQVVCKFGTEYLDTVAIDSSTFQVTKANMTRQMSHGHVFCHVNVSGKMSLIAQVVIRVADIPIAPAMKECIVYNWERMVCTWEEPLDTGLNTTYNLGWSVLPPDYHYCPHQDGNSCEWKAGDDKGNGLKMDMAYYLRMFMENSLQKVNSATYRYLTTDIVKPNPVTSISAIGITTESAEIWWIWHDTVERPLIFRISVESEWDSINTTMETDHRNITLVGLLPYTTYSVFIECKYFLNRVQRGFWSDKKFFEFRTAESVPSRAPSVTLGGYHVRSVIGKERIVDVFWQPLHQQFLQGPLLGYQLKYFGINEPYRADRFAAASRSVPYFHRTNLSLGLDIGVNVMAETMLGLNKSLELDTVLIPRAGAAPRTPEVFYAIERNSEIVVGWSPVLNASGYTVYWCKREPSMECETSLSWKSLPQNITNFTIEIGGSKFREFVVAISVEAYDDSLQREISSGFVEAECVHDGTKDVLTPENFRKAKDQQAYNFTVEWTKPNCHNTAFILGYELFYCERLKCEDQVCCHENHTLNVSNSVTKFTITNLKADGEYEARIRSRSLVGVSEFSPSVRHVVFRSGLSAGIIAAIVIAAIVLLILMTVGLVTIAKKIKKYLNCCGKIEICVPPAVVFVPNSNDQGLSISGYNSGLLQELHKGETQFLLNENSKEQEAELRDNGHPEKQPLKPNGNARHDSEELFQPFVPKVPELEDLCHSGVEPSNDSSISPYTHLAVPEDSSANHSIYSNKLYQSSVDASGPASHVATQAEPTVAEPELESRRTQSYLPVGGVPVSGNSSSTIAPYTTVEQIAEPPEAIRPPAICYGGFDTGQESSETKDGDGKDASKALVDNCGLNDNVTNSQPAYANHPEFVDNASFKGYIGGSAVLPSVKPPLPVTYIPLAPSLST